jgi:hypothetical protein
MNARVSDLARHPFPDGAGIGGMKAPPIGAGRPRHVCAPVRARDRLRVRSSHRRLLGAVALDRIRELCWPGRCRDEGGEAGGKQAAFDRDAQPFAVRVPVIPSVHVRDSSKWLRSCQEDRTSTVAQRSSNPMRNRREDRLTPRQGARDGCGYLQGPIKSPRLTKIQRTLPWQTGGLYARCLDSS